MTGHPRLSNWSSRDYNLPALPRSDTMLTDKNSSRFYCFNLLADGDVPEAPGSNVRFIQPRFNLFLGQFLCYLANRRLVLAVVAQEDIKDLGLGVLPVHGSTVLSGAKNKVDFEISA